MLLDLFWNSGQLFHRTQPRALRSGSFARPVVRALHSHLRLLLPHRLPPRWVHHQWGIDPYDSSTFPPLEPLQGLVPHHWLFRCDWLAWDPSQLRPQPLPGPLPRPGRPHPPCDTPTCRVLGPSIPRTIPCLNCLSTGRRFRHGQRHFPRGGSGHRDASRWVRQPHCLQTPLGTRKVVTGSRMWLDLPTPSATPALPVERHLLGE